MRVLFLDIDGVLDSVRSAVALDKYPHNLSRRSLKKFDWVAIGLVRKLCAECNVEIVLSSVWRHGFSCEDMSKALQLPIKYKTGTTRAGVRGVEIQEWLNSHPEVENYAIVDDDSDMLGTQKPHFVQTSFEDGLSYNNYLQLKKIFSQH